MVLQLPARSVQLSEEAGPVTADVFGVLAKIVHGVRRCSEQSRVANPLMRADEVAQGRWYGVGQHEVMARQHPAHLRHQPEVRLVVLTPGTMAIHWYYLTPAAATSTATADTLFDFIPLRKH